MIANVEQALAHLKHKRTGELLATKNIARNTKLVYFADELVGLRFHKTDIALYMDEGVRLDTRECPDDPSPFGQGWFTMTTWERIDSFTPARTFTTNGLRYVRDVPSGESHLYVPGMIVRIDGSLDPDTIMQPELESRIVRTKAGFTAKAKRFANKVVERWSNWAAPLHCCRSHPLDSEAGHRHYLDHFDANEYAVPTDMDNWADVIRTNLHVTGPELLHRLRDTMAHNLHPLLTLSIKTLSPEFPYPQMPKRRTGVANAGVLF